MALLQRSLFDATPGRRSDRSSMRCRTEGSRHSESTKVFLRKRALLFLTLATPASLACSLDFQECLRCRFSTCLDCEGSPRMSLTVEDFHVGVCYWQRQTPWPPDFHNRFYSRMTELNPNGTFDMAWWTCFLSELTKWKATRGRGKT